MTNKYSDLVEVERQNPPHDTEASLALPQDDHSSADGLERRDILSNPDAAISFANFHEQYVGKYIQLADSKASFVFAFATGISAYLLTSKNILEIVIRPSLSLPFFIWSTIIVLLALSAAFAFFVIFPRQSTSSGDLVFWKSVASFNSAEEYVRSFSNVESSEIAHQRLKHCYDLSKICVTKYELLRRSMLAGVTGITGVCVSLLLS